MNVIKSGFSEKLCGKNSAHAMEVPMLANACVYNLTMLSKHFTIPATVTPPIQFNSMDDMMSMSNSDREPGRKTEIRNNICGHCETDM